MKFFAAVIASAMVAVSDASTYPPYVAPTTFTRCWSQKCTDANTRYAWCRLSKTRDRTVDVPRSLDGWIVAEQASGSSNVQYQARVTGLEESRQYNIDLMSVSDGTSSI